MNKLYLVVPSNLKNSSDFIRLADSIDNEANIHLYFINQSPDLALTDVYQFRQCKVTELRTGHVVPLSKARNLALQEMYSDNTLQVENAIIMFVDDDAWFPKETLECILHEPVRARCLRTIDPEKNKSFNGLSYIGGRVKGWHIIHDIPSICLVAPYNIVYRGKYYFNEKLGLGCEISQGEESLFIYYLTKDGMDIYYDKHYIYHPYKRDINLKNKYSLSYFWALGLFHVSRVFLWPTVKYLGKYTVAVLLGVKNTAYFAIFRNVWKGFFDGMRDSKRVLKNE